MKNRSSQAVESLLKYCKVQVPVRHAHDVTIYHIIAHSYRETRTGLSNRKNRKISPNRSADFSQLCKLRTDFVLMKFKHKACSILFSPQTGVWRPWKIEPVPEMQFHYNTDRTSVHLTNAYVCKTYTCHRWWTFCVKFLSLYYNNQPSLDWVECAF